MSIGFINGKYVSLNEPVIPIEDRGHQFGDGIYEVIRVYNGKPFMLDEHLTRLMNSAQAIRLPLRENQNHKYFQGLIKEAIGKSGLLECSVYLQITRGFAPRNHLFPENTPVSISMAVKPITPIAQAIRNSGVKTIIHDDERWANCYIKSLNLLPNILARQTAYDNGCFEAILIRDGFITEGTSSNIFMIKKGKVFTTPLSKKILPGITRAAVKQICAELNIDFIEKEYTTNELFQAEELFLTSTTAEILPIVEVSGQKIGTGCPGTVTQKLDKQYMIKTGQKENV